ncbi:MAG: type II toxin-antitoxin system VapC family toxin [Thermoleophilia bacterium]|nr:type II toxin-antitoxin system VapC family toxin [Thermoleophilia bacterium]
MAFLLDTNVVSELRRPRPDPHVREWFGGVASVDLHLSVLVTGEIRRGVELLRPREPERAASLDEWLEGLVVAYGDRLLPVSAPVADAWGRLSSLRPLPVADGLMLATAKVHGLTLVSREAAALADLGVPTVSPWEALGGAGRAT